MIVSDTGKNCSRESLKQLSGGDDIPAPFLTRKLAHSRKWVLILVALKGFYKGCADTSERQVHEIELTANS
jgi:hypothetical protein